MAEVLGTQRNGAEGVPHEDGPLTGGRSGQYGVSDDRRAQLSQMEQDAGVQHDAVDESVPQRPEAQRSPAAGGESEGERTGDRH